MKIGIDARFWSQTGVGRYTKNLVIELSKLDKKNEYVLFANEKDIPDISSKINNDRWSIVKCNIKWHSLSEQFLFSKVLNSNSLDLVHFPYFSHPIFYNKSFVVTIHDLIINHFPTGKASTQPMSLYVLKWLGYRKVLSHAVKKSKKIIVPLKFVKNDLSRTLEVPQNKIEVTPEGFDPAISKGKISNKAIYQILDTKYFLYVGNAYPHKNLEKLIEGFYKSKADANLILVGKDDYFYKRLEKEKFRNLIFLHDVTDSELFHLYSNSIAAVSASLMEGFGLLPLEAFGCGTIPVVSNIPAFGEVCHDSAIYFNPQDADDIAKKLNFVLKLPAKERENLIKKGKAILSRFSWEKMAKETLRIYESCSSPSSK
ncbi:MAG: glycosyltransferase family 1 protein [Candidatus Levyibacteriota bacterium]